MKITTVGLDLAKNVFHVIGLNQANTLVLKKPGSPVGWGEE